MFLRHLTKCFEFTFVRVVRVEFHQPVQQFAAMPSHSPAAGAAPLNAAFAPQKQCMPPTVLRGLNSQQIVDGESQFRIYTTYTNVGSDLDCAFEKLQL